MLRRWIIRTLALALLTLCVTAWVGSYWRAAEVISEGSAIWKHAKVEAGRMGYDESSMVLGFAPKREFNFRPAYPDCWDVWDSGIFFFTCGFHFDHNSKGTFITIPLWFPTLLSAGLLWLVWRKTRPTYTGKGFPVEPPSPPPPAPNRPQPSPERP